MSESFDSAAETARQVLNAALAKQLAPVYCVRCGSKLQVRISRHVGFDKATGYPIYSVLLGCRYAVLYETSVLEGPSFAWRAPFGRHSVQRISKSIGLNSDLADAHYRRGDAHHETGEYTKAIAEYDLAIRLAPEHALAYYNRGLAYHKTGDVLRASDDLERCTRLSTDPALTKAAQRAKRKIEDSA